MMSCCNYIGMVIDVRFASGYWQLRESLGIFGCVIEDLLVTTFFAACLSFLSGG